jgi:hypothetical protein
VEAQGHEPVWDQETRGPLPLERAFLRAEPQQIAPQAQERPVPQQAAEALELAAESASLVEAEQ